MVKILITGGEGFIGGRIKVLTGGTSFDIKSGLDVLDTANLARATEDASQIFHCAAKISVPESFQIPNEYYKTNVLGTKNVIEAAKKSDSKIVFSSSAAVYGEANKIVGENAPMSPLSPYAENKKDAENLLHETKIPSVALRYFNVYGPGQSAAYAGVITAFILNALKGEDLKIFGNGKQVRDFIYVDDVARANIAAMNYSASNFEIFNIGSGVETSINDLAELIIKLTNSSSKIIHLEARTGDIVYSCADVSKAKNILNWSAETKLEDGLRETIEYYKNQVQ